MRLLKWSIYLIIFTFSAVYVFKNVNYTKKIQIIDGYALNFSLKKGEILNFFLNSQKSHKKGLVYIYSSSYQIIDSCVFNLLTQAPSTDTMSYKNGLNYKNLLHYNTSKLKPGLYFIGKVVPFLVNDPQATKTVTIVFPYGNLNAISNSGGKSFSGDNSSHGVAAEKLSLQRFFTLHNKPQYFLFWADSVLKKFNLSFISDLDLENKNALSKTQLLVFYAYQKFWTIKARQNLDDYINRGGQTLIMCSNFINNHYIFDQTNQSLRFNEKDQYYVKSLGRKTELCWKWFYPNTQSMGCSYELTCSNSRAKNEFNGYKILLKDSPVFKEINSSFIKFEKGSANCLNVGDCNYIGDPPSEVNIPFFNSCKIMAYEYCRVNSEWAITGIFYLKKNSHCGEIIVIGNENWTNEENLSKPEISVITKNCIEYLYNRSNSLSTKI